MTAMYHLEHDVAVITLDHPPVNGLCHATRIGIMNALNRALDDASVKAIVVTGAGNAFSGGADIREFGTPAAFAEPSLATVIGAIEASAKPVVAAIHSVAMGGGLELALGCHYRLATRDAKIALPEVNLGLLPGAGGTQRLPRAIGLEAALNMIVRARPGSRAVRGRGAFRRDRRGRRARRRRELRARRSRKRRDASAFARHRRAP